MKKDIDWQNLTFSYMDTGKYVMSVYQNGAWGPIELKTDPHINIHIAATPLHYGQACFEGLKAFTQKNGDVAIFRPDANGERMIRSAERIVMQAPPVELFVDACKQVVKENLDYVPPFGTGASLYLRPFIFGLTPKVGVQPSDDYAFIVFATPVGPYYKGGMKPIRAYVQEKYDRAAPKGVGNAKVAGNYAAGLLGDKDAKKKGFSTCLYLDSAEHKYIDEFSASNFFAISKDKKTYITSNSAAALPSITNDALQTIARDLGMNVEKRPVPFSELGTFSEVGACGTAAVITPVGEIVRGEMTLKFGEMDKPGETLTKLYNQLTGIQNGVIADTHGWTVKV